MGFFATYCGLIYNDCMSNPLYLFETTFHYEEFAQGEFRNQSGYWPSETDVYTFGIDPTWYHKGNSLMFLNSLKMKLAVTIGVIHMLVAVTLSLANHLHFGDRIKAVFEFVPRFLFLACTFGWMIFLIVYKFTIDWAMFGDRAARQPPPPNLITVSLSHTYICTCVSYFCKQCNSSLDLLTLIDSNKSVLSFNK